MSRERASTSKTTPPDEHLVRAFREDPEGDAGRAAAGRLLERYQGRVYAWCLRMLRDPDRALDAAQEAMLSAYRGLPRFRGEARFSSWLFAIVRNRCLRKLRPAPLLEDGDAEPDRAPSPERGPLEVLEEREGLKGLLELVRVTLTPREQEALWLRCFEKIPVEEITRLLGVEGPSGARGLLQRARRKLSAALARSGREGSSHDR